MKIVFMGTPQFAKGVLESLINNNYNVVAVVTQPDKKIGRKQIVKYSPVKELALKLNIPVIQPIKIRKDYSEILNYKPDLIITAAYGQIIPKELLEYPKYKCINVHGSLLPKYRGGAPIQKAIMNGEKKTGITIMYMGVKMDAGDILSQEALEISESDTSSSLFKKMEYLGASLLIKSLPDILNGNVKGVKQDESKVTYAYNISKSEEYINFYRDVNEVYNHIRSLLESPVGNARIEGKTLKFHKVKKIADIHGEAGEFIGLIDNNIAIACQNGTILVEEIQQSGKKIVNGKSYYNGFGRNLVGKFFDKE